MVPDPTAYPGYESSRPYVRWWWLDGPFMRAHIAAQLDWLNANGFGGVELAWIDPTWRSRRSDAPRPEWLGDELGGLIGYAKRYAENIGLGCDFTFGSGSPFGGSQVGLAEAQQVLDGPSPRRLNGSWEAGPRLIVDHLSETALRRYAEPLSGFFLPALSGQPSALFCDAQELEAADLWTADLWDQFEARYGYRLEGRLDLARTHPHMRYEYRRMVGSALLSGFFEAFAQVCREQGAISRAQCHGLPVDPLVAYASVDVPEAEAPLYPPAYSRIPASAAALVGKDLVTCELFSSLYGVIGPGNVGAARYWRKEQAADLKLVADAALANGANGIVWHGLPFNGPMGTNEFFASVHLGSDVPLAAELADFNAYLETVCGMLRRGRPFAQVAVYLPFEDALIADRAPEEQRQPGETFAWELRHAAPPPEVEGYHPLWISEPFLRHAEYADGEIRVGGVGVGALYVDVAWMDAAALEQIVRLARAGAPVVLKRAPNLPGMRRHPRYAGWLEELASLPNVVRSAEQLAVRPLVAGDDLPPYWARQGAGELLIFFAHPLAQGVRYPLLYGQSYAEAAVERTVTLSYGGVSQQVTLTFEPNQSLMVRLTRSGEFGLLDLDYRPPTPVRDPLP
ncbi:MAG: hypothetical protein IT306_24265 [Chloroflexi bacterium]|nr:hypothetical protein [Chloroflexota bacterium]